jgi:hypothetical protein
MPRFQTSVRNPALWFIAALAAAGVLAGCGGGGGGSVPAPAGTYAYGGATASPTPSIAPTAQATSFAVTTSGGTAKLGGITNSSGTSNLLTSVTVTLPAVNDAGLANVSVTAAAPSPVPAPDARLRKILSLGVTPTPFVYVALTFAQDETLGSAPGFTFSFPSTVNLPYGANAYIVMYSSSLPGGWAYASGPVTIGGSPVTFNVSPMASPLLIPANTTYYFALVSTGTIALATPSATPVPTPSPVGTGGLSGSQIDHITGLGATFDATGDMTETESGAQHTYDVIYKPVPQQSWVLTPSLSTVYTYFGYPTIHMELDPTGPSPSPLPTEYQNDKVNLTIGVAPIPSPSTAASSADDLWESFDFALDPKTNVPGQNVLLAQWWQGEPFSPPVDLILKANANYECFVDIRNNNTGGNPSAVPIDLDAGSCAPTDAGGNILWHQFRIHIRFGYENDGIVQVWHNNMTTPVINESGIDVGYVPGECVYIEGNVNNGCLSNGGATPAPPDVAPTPSNKMTAYFGPYRPSDPHTIIMYITNVKFAKDEDSADPTTP